MLKNEVNIQVLKVDRRLITFSRPLFLEIKRFRAARKLTNRMVKIYNTI